MRPVTLQLDGPAYSASVRAASPTGRGDARRARLAGRPRAVATGTSAAIASAATTCACPPRAVGHHRRRVVVPPAPAGWSAGRLRHHRGRRGHPGRRVRRARRRPGVGHLADPVLSVQAKQSVTDAAQQQISQAQMARLELRAPLSGVVQKQIAHRGEYVGPGTPILTVADPTDLKLTLFVLEGDLGRVAVGQRVSIHADAFADRTFSGHVTTIASRAEFTPRNVQTQRDRQNLVFAVTVRVPNADSALKAGLPVDATFDGSDVPPSP
ncbi:MAG: efflux RND transporter periplasmic adaptor subunit [Chloroflexi bacterium]|nr:MAG: efflux RND transporter periplasmic adaptor subunit [Chloroflexota bacterium]